MDASCVVKTARCFALWNNGTPALKNRQFLKLTVACIAFDLDFLREAVTELRTDNDQGEFYLTGYGGYLQ